MKTLKQIPNTFKSDPKKVFFLVMLVAINVFTACDKEADEVKPKAPTPQPVEEEFTHKVPNGPILLDGIAAAPEEVLKYNGKPLFYIIDQQTVKEGVIRIFTDEQKADVYREQSENEITIASPADQVSRTVATEGFTAIVHLFTESSYGGSHDYFSLGNTDAYNLFTYKYGCNWLGSNCKTIDNKISSIKCQTMPKHWTVLFSSPAYQGQKMWIAPGVNIPFLSWYGFNDITSSIGFVPYSLH